MSSKTMKEEDILGRAFDMKLMRRLLRYAVPYRKHIFACFALLAFITATDLAAPYLIKIAIDDNISKGDTAGLLNLSLLFFAVTASGFAMNYVQTYILNYTGQKIIYNMREELFGHIERLPLRFFDKTPVGRLVTRVTNDMETLNDMYTSVLVNLFKDAFLLIGIIIAMMSMNLKLSLVCLSTLPLIAAATHIFRREVREAYRSTRVRLARINASISENITGMRIIQFFSREKAKAAEFDAINRDHLSATMRELFVFSIFRPGMDLIYSLTLALLIWYGGSGIISGSIEFGVLFAFISYIRQFFSPINDLAEKFNIMQGAMASSERIFLLLDEEEEVYDCTAPKKCVRFTSAPKIEFRNVSFEYEPDNCVLRDVSFTIEKGRTAAFVGATGAGKSTIISLIARFYDVEKGEILIDGIDIKDIPLQDLRENIGTVLQDVFLFSGDISSNINLGNDSISEDKVKATSRFVNASVFIEKLEGKYHAEVKERGATLSSGQRQLLSFARALAFEPKLLILDEATSNIDTESEMLIQDAIKKVVRDRTTIVIAHRLSTVQHADTIFVMHKGQIAESGTHDELLSREGIYHSLYKLQYKHISQVE